MADHHTTQQNETAGATKHRIKELEEWVACYEAMKRGVAVRIADLEQRAATAETERDELRARYKRLKDAINGSVPRDLEYMVALEKDNKRLQAECGELLEACNALNNWATLTPPIELLQKVGAVVKMVPPETITLGDHAEAWQRERGEPVPPRDTPEWQAMYEVWVDYAFADFPDVKD